METTSSTQQVPAPFTTAEVTKVLVKLKSGTAAGYENISSALLKHLVTMALKWLTQFYSRNISEKSIRIHGDRQTNVPLLSWTEALVLFTLLMMSLSHGLA